MEENTNKFQQYFQQNSIIITGFAIFQIIIIVVCVYVIQLLNSPNYQPTQARINQISEKFPDLPSDAPEIIQKTLYKTIKLNSDTSIIDLEALDVKIKDDSIKDIYFQRQNIHYLNFFVEVPSFEQGYQVFYEWTDDVNNPYFLVNRSLMVMCPLETQKIYPNFDCKDEYNLQGQKIIASEFISYFEFQSLSVSVSKKEKDQINILPIVETSDNVKKESYINEVKTKIASLGIPPEIFTYYVMMDKDLDFEIPPEYLK